MKRILPNAVICDIDGTLAHMNGRSPYDPTKYHEDIKDDFVHRLFALLTSNGEIRIIVSGRSDEYREVTEKWLEDNGVTYQFLFMRDHTRVDEKGNKVNDAIIKREIYENFIKDKFNVICTIDDRNRVVDMWRNELGLICLQVADGDF
jgi:hydroxymethylpyrimidine pyrophosphatase-like HAD family hydrolase